MCTIYNIIFLHIKCILYVKFISLLPEFEAFLHLSENRAATFTIFNHKEFSIITQNLHIEITYMTCPKLLLHWKKKEGVAQLVIEFSVWFVVCIPFSRKSQESRPSHSTYILSKSIFNASDL